ncbi:MAG TPA: TIGR00730 family Rossman fold protein [Candidatus Paceibacterota bacterium]|nr:TIGR00730 family Rossman fold protein [Candidatus Paceibacterota bacterium]
MDDDKKGQMNLPASKLPVHKPKQGEDFRKSLHWRVFRILSEFVEGWQFLADFKKTVSFFGSTRSPEGSKWYEEARKLGKMATEAGFAVVTGGGPGIMEAGNRGAVEGGGNSIGLNIQLDMEQRINPYVQQSVAFHYFFVRKVMLSFAARAYVFFPGGLGTLDEVFELVTLIQTKKISEKIPVVLMGKEYWGNIDKLLKEQLYEKYQTIDKEDMDIYKIVDSAEEAFELIKDAPPREDWYY